MLFFPTVCFDAPPAEQYDEAKRLKAAIDNLKQIGAQLSKLEKSKLQAVSEEDYDRAKSLKVRRNTWK